MTETMNDAVLTVDLDATDLTWVEHHIAGADEPARIALLRADADRGTRTVMVRFPDGWTRAAVGNQPAGEEMVVLEGELRLSGLVGDATRMLVVEPKATRSATSTADGTRAVVWFSGAGGGWEDGEADDAGAITGLELADGATRSARPGLVGTVEVLAGAAGRVFEVDVDVLWPDARQWAFVPAGTAAPAVEGLAIIHTWA
ncbi:DUF4437 domain-containing protein [Nocardioides sp. GY 10113]|uniref:DUF4437 domain-containing protein n=1 Tax=Nocardioides sp. GY 10113 TaxID=2569761 RepID=UPI0010A90646|nr:DUF4437 domain-containing protein [Nocardioides sp. GY 10113]TIC88032.1 DUF4437 domain-containing protein [Nocardioides sp. GY 10113]